MSTSKVSNMQYANLKDMAAAQAECVLPDICPKRGGATRIVVNRVRSQPISKKSLNYIFEAPHAGE